MLHIGLVELTTGGAELLHMAGSIADIYNLLLFVDLYRYMHKSKKFI